MIKTKKAQGWSLDVMIAVGVFLLVIIAFFYLSGNSLSSVTVKQLKAEADMVTEKITSDTGNVSFAQKNAIDKDKLGYFARNEYFKMKDELGISNDFCIYFEDSDGNIVNITYITNSDSFGIGSPKAMIPVEGGYIICGQKE